MLMRIVAESGDIGKYEIAFDLYLISQYIKDDLINKERYMTVDIISFDDFESIVKNVKAINRSADVKIEHRISDKEFVVLIQDKNKYNNVSYFKFTCLKCKSNSVYVETVFDDEQKPLSKICCDDCGYFEEY